MSTQTKILGWLQIAMAGLAAVMQAIAGLHAQPVDAGHVSLTAGVLASGINHLTKVAK